MAIYTFRDPLLEVVEEKFLSSLRAALMLARYDIALKIVEPISIEDRGWCYTREDILRLTTYNEMEGVRVSSSVPTPHARKEGAA